ncbi:MAG: exodeoxyribonuclease V subunit alpha [Neisseria sp.]|nr:exodeoxyribonuclease V subunit alpha [Neisseria sp.]
MIALAPFERFFARLAPDAAQHATPLLAKVLAAWEEGHAFVRLNDAQTRAARAAAPLIAENAAAPLVLSRQRLFLGKVWDMERDCARHLSRLAAAGAPPAGNFAPLFAEYFPDAASHEQAQAAALALLHHFLLISGGPGTGKTTTVAKILALLCHAPTELPRIALTAPTGKAAAHLQQSLRRTLDTFRLPENIHAHLSALNGQTLHRLLGIAPPLLRARYDADNVLPYDIIIADEASMIDLSLMHKLLTAVGKGSRLILLGDENQLPSVGAGAVLSALARPTVLTAQAAAQLQTWLPAIDIAQSDAPPPLSSAVARLTVSRRFAADSGIGQLARAVADNQADAVACFDRFPQQLQLSTRNPKLFQDWYALQHDYWQAIRAGDLQAAFTHFYDGMMLCVLRRDTEAFNRGYLKFLRQHGHGEEYFDGRALLITRNHPALEIYNGDIGIVLRTADDARAAVYFPDGNQFRRIDIGRLGAHEDAFALTVHKSQGSEYREVRLLAPADAPPELFDRTLLYTAITRAKQRFVYIGSAESFTRAARTRHDRRSALGDFLS